MSDVILDRTCETLADCVPSLRWLNQMCGKIAVGHVVSPAGHSHLVCADCIKEYEATNESRKTVNGNASRLGDVKTAKLYEINRW